MFSSNKLILVSLLVASLEGSSVVAFTSSSPTTNNLNQQSVPTSSTMMMAMQPDSSSNMEEASSTAASSRRSLLQQSLLAAGSLALSGFGVPHVSQAAAAAVDVKVGGAAQYGDESIMSPKAHGTSAQPVQQDLLYGVSNKLADKICNFNRYVDVLFVL